MRLVGLGLAYFDQRFQTGGRAPPRHAWAALGELVLGLNLEITRGVYCSLEAGLQAYLLPMLDLASRETQLRAAGSARLSLGAGTRS